MKWWVSVWAMEIRKILAYRSDFWITFLGQTTIQLLIARALWQSIFEAQGTDSMKGFTLPMLTLYYLIVPIGTRILTGENIGFISREIYDGTFTRYLIYPLSFFQYKTITYLTQASFYGVQLILLYTLYHLFYTDSAGSAVNLFTGLGLFFSASITYLSMAMSLELMSLWADNVWSLGVMLRFFTSFFGGGFIPMVFFPDWARVVLEWTPFPYLVGLPVRATMGLVTTPEILQGLVLMMSWSLVFMGLARFIWRRGQKHFTGVGI
ncbi:MAG TPA: ABC-2 family transporter protein [Bacteriovoracaceae bacterium]|nr:ABC-2 family transporter protein [Bacteriovoracaceae bacterium]